LFLYVLVYAITSQTFSKAYHAHITFYLWTYM